MKPGDLVFFTQHAAAYRMSECMLEMGRSVHSSSKKAGGVRVDNLDLGYYNRAFRGARRVRKDSSEPSGE